MVIYVCATDEDNALERAGAGEDEYKTVQEAKDHVEPELREEVFQITVTKVEGWTS